MEEKNAWQRRVEGKEFSSVAIKSLSISSHPSQLPKAQIPSCAWLSNCLSNQATPNIHIYVCVCIYIYTYILNVFLSLPYINIGNSILAWILKLVSHFYDSLPEYKLDFFFSQWPKGILLALNTLSTP